MIEMATIDTDTIVYKAAGACQRINPETKEVEVKDPVEFAYGNAKRMMQQILSVTEARDYVAYLTASKNTECFRTKLYPEYKANRKDLVRPVYYQDVRDYLIKNWKVEISEKGIEADDKVCEKQYQFYNNQFIEDEKVALERDWISYADVYVPSVLCGIDKDLDQIPGLHMNYNTWKFYYITPLQGLKNMYLQMLIGDDVDNIPRIRPRWGLKKEHKQVKKALQGAKSEVELYHIVFDEIERLNTEYMMLYPKFDNAALQIDLIGNLVYLRKHSQDSYRRPYGTDKK